MKWLVTAPCQEKRTLLYAYIHALETHNKDMREFSKSAMSGDDSTAMKERAVASRETCHATRKRYTDHIHEHGC